MKSYSNAHVKIFQNWVKESLSKEEAGKVVGEVLKLAWVQRFQVFADQVVMLVDLNSGTYIYVSPSIKNISGFTPEEFTDVHVASSLMSPRELEITIQISTLLVGKMMELNLPAHQVLRTHSVRNVFSHTKDGRLINLLQHGFALAVNEEGIPQIQMLIISDISAFNNKQEHFYSLALTNEDGTEETLLAGRIENTDDEISSREQEILKLISMGDSSQVIARQLHISTETVKTHRKNLLEKTNAKNSIDLVRYGYAHGWL